MRLSFSLFCASVTLCACTAHAPGDSQLSALPGAQGDSLKTYVNTQGKYSIEYPTSWTMTENTNPRGSDPRFRIDTRFTPFLPDKETSMLLDAQAHLTVMDSCPVVADAKNVTIGGLPFHQSTWHEEAADATYQGWVYTTQKGTDCYYLMLQVHVCKPQSKCAGAGAKPFDSAPFVTAFTQMVRSFRLR